MRLGVNLAYQGAAELARTAENLGYEVAFVPEGYRSDGATVLGLVAGQTERIDLASGVFQIPARAPGMTALTAATLDALSGGRFRLGLGVSNPDISEGWYGVPFDEPLSRTREYVEVVRRALRREPVHFRGRHVRLPPDERTGTPLRLLTDPVRAQVPIYLAAVGPRNLELAGEIADGWLGIFCPPAHVRAGLGHVAAGRDRAGRDVTGYDVVISVPTVVGDDPSACADGVRNYVAHFVGLGDRRRNFYYALAERLGYARAARTVSDRYAEGDLAGAAAAVPGEFVDQVSLLGPPDRIADRMRAYAEAGVSTLAISPFAATPEGRLAIVRSAVDAFQRAGLG